MIPKIIHYCWFGGGEMPVEYTTYIQQWTHMHAGWIFKRWDESNAPMSLPYIQKALALKNWANISNYVRLYALRLEGGIYLDTDMKLVQPLDSLLTYNCFLGFEAGELGNTEYWLNNAIMGAIHDHPFVVACEQYILEHFDGAEKANLSAPHVVTFLLKEHYGLQKYGRQLLNDVMLFEKEVFYPIPYNKAYLLKEEQTYDEETIAVHMWGRTWFDHAMMLDIIDELQRHSNEERSYTLKIAEDLKENAVQLENARVEINALQTENSNLKDHARHLEVAKTEIQVLRAENHNLREYATQLEKIRAEIQALQIENENLKETKIERKEKLDRIYLIDQRISVMDAAINKANQVIEKTAIGIEVIQVQLTIADEKHENRLKLLELTQQTKLDEMAEAMRQKIDQLRADFELQFSRQYQRLEQTVNIVEALTGSLKKQEEVIDQYKKMYDESSLWLIAKRRLLNKQKP